MLRFLSNIFIAALLLGFGALLLGAKPAARVSDMHTCPLFTGLIPHVGGPITTGSPTVLICGLPAATVGSIATCNGPADRIIRGSATVLINGLPAARLGDGTAHSGVIVAGCATVLIGP